MKQTKTNTMLGLIFSTLILAGCNGEMLSINLVDDDGSASGQTQTVVNYDLDQTLVLGEQQSILPSNFVISDHANLECTIEEAPEWILIDSKTCAIEVTSIKVGQFGPYTVKITDGINQVQAKVAFTVEQPKKATLPVDSPSTPIVAPEVSIYYQSTALISNSSYFATFSATGLTFIDARNPYLLNVVKVIGAGRTGQLQAITSTPNYIHAVTTTGYVLSYDWTDLKNPVLVQSTRILDGGQNFDLATDKKENLFIANTDRKRFSVLNISDPLNPTLDFHYDDLGSYGAGVTYANGYVYVADYNGAVFTFTKDQNNQWTFISEVKTEVPSASRPFANSQYLLVAQYGGSGLDVFSLKDKKTPVHLETLDVGGVINIYSRSFIHDQQLYVSMTSDGQAQILVYDIFKDQPLKLSYTYLPKNDDGQSYGQASIDLFRNNSFMSIIGYDKAFPKKREIKTRHMALNDDSVSR